LEAAGNGFIVGSVVSVVLWKMYGYGPSIDEIMNLTGDRGRGNVSRKMWRLVELGICKGIKGRPRTIRPSYLRVSNIE
jgi:hypothetical protein